MLNNYQLVFATDFDPVSNLAGEINFCMLPHYHSEHFGRIVEEKSRKDLPIIITEPAAEGLKNKNSTAFVALDAWESVTIEKANPERVSLQRLSNTVIFIAYDVSRSPLEDFKRAEVEAGLTNKMMYLDHGETHNFQISTNNKQKTRGKIK